MTKVSADGYRNGPGRLGTHPIADRSAYFGTKSLRTVAEEHGLWDDKKNGAETCSKVEDQDVAHAGA